MIITKGTTNTIKLPLAQYFEEDNLRTMIAAEVTFGATSAERVRKLWYRDNRSISTMSIDRLGNNLCIELNPMETIKWNYQVPVQIRIKKKDNDIICSNIFYANINMSLSTEEF